MNASLTDSNSYSYSSSDDEYKDKVYCIAFTSSIKSIDNFSQDSDDLLDEESDDEEVLQFAYNSVFEESLKPKKMSLATNKKLKNLEKEKADLLTKFCDQARLVDELKDSKSSLETKVKSLENRTIKF